MKATMIFLLCAVFGLSVSRADDDYVACLSGYQNYCSSQGYSTRFFICDDWDGSDEICVHCLQGSTVRLFAGCGGPEVTIPSNTVAPDCRSTQRGASKIDETGNNFQEEIPVTGTNLKLVFSSDRGLRRLQDYQINLKLHDSAPTTFSSYSYKIQIAGRTISQVLPVSNQFLNWTWNGINQAGQNTLGGAMADIQIFFNGSYSGPALQLSMPLGNWKVDQLGLGGWSLDSVHYYDVETAKLYLGSGETVQVGYQELDSGEIGVSLSPESEIYIFSSQGRHLRTLAGLTGAVLQTVTYDAAGRLTKVTDGFGKAITVLRNASGVFTGIQSAYGVTTAATVNAAGYLATVANPAGAKFDMTYNASGMLQTFKKPTGEITTFSVNTTGGLVKDSHSGGSFFQYLQSIVNGAQVYNRTTAMNRSRTITIKNTSTTAQTQVREPSGVLKSTTQIFGPTGKITFSVADTSKTTNFGEDPRFGAIVKQVASIEEKHGGLLRQTVINRTASLTDPLDPFSINTYSTTESINGRNYVSTYTGTTKTLVERTPFGRKKTTVMNVYQQPISSSVGSLQGSNFEYDTDGRLVKLTQGTRVTQMGYDTKGFLSFVTNPLNQKMTFGYDLVGRTTTVTLPDNRILNYGYDSSGRITTITPSGRPNHGFVYNAMELMQKYSPPILNGTEKPIQYVYNNDKQLTRIDKPDGTQLFFDVNPMSGQLSSVRTSSASLYFYTYEPTKGLLMSSVSQASGVRQNLTYTGQMLNSEAWLTASTSAQIGRITNAYNAQYFRTSYSLAGSATSPSTVVSFTYDTDGLIVKAGNADYFYNLTEPLLNKMNLLNTTESFSFNSFGELTGKQTKLNTGSVIYNGTYTRDSLGRVSAKSETANGNTVNFGYTYDSVGRLTKITKNGALYSEYVYDANNNRTGGQTGGVSITATYDNQDRLLTYNNLTFSYNDNGERLQQTEVSTGAVTRYQYDPMGNLVKVTLPSGSIIDYIYDGSGRLHSRKLNGVVTASYLYDGHYKIVGDLDSAGNLRTSYVYVSDEHSPDFMIRSSVTYKFLKDQIGSIRFVVNASTGAVVQEITYDEFGKVLTNSNPDFQPFAFAGGLYDSSTKLAKFGARHYDPSTGRWLSKDPILFNGGDTNLYGYVANDPVNWVDSDGLKKTFVFQGGNLTLYGDNGQQLFSGPAGSGPYGNGALPQGLYSVGGMRDNRTGSYSCSGSSGYSLNLNPQFSTNRTNLRIHPDGGVPGTLGCIGVSCSNGNADALGNILRGIYNQPMTPWIDLEVR